MNDGNERNNIRSTNTKIRKSKLKLKLAQLEEDFLKSVKLTIFRYKKISKKTRNTLKREHGLAFAQDTPIRTMNTVILKISVKMKTPFRIGERKTRYMRPSYETNPRLSVGIRAQITLPYNGVSNFSSVLGKSLISSVVLTIITAKKIFSVYHFATANAGENDAVKCL